MKSYYFHQMKEDSLGPILKISSQVNTFNSYNMNMKLVCAGNGKRKSKWAKFLARVPFLPTEDIYRYKSEYNNSDCFYVRFQACDFYLIMFLFRLRKHSPKAKILMEFPDYPYYKQLKEWHRIPILLKDLMWRGQLKKYIDVVVAAGVDSIYGIPAVPLINGIEVGKVKKKEVIDPRGKINIIAVSAMFPIHGYERFIVGMYHYYQENEKERENIILHLVGNGPEIFKYKRIVDTYSLQDKVIFYGQLRGADLDAVYNYCEIGLETLAFYRCNITLSSSLKSREYLSRGIPLITGCKNDILDQGSFRFFLEFHNDESTIDIEKVVTFYHSIYSNGQTREKIIEEIRNFAFKTCDMSVTMQPVIDYIKGEKL